MRNKPLPGLTPVEKRNVNKYAANKRNVIKEKETTNIKSTTDFLTKKHTIYKNKNLTLRGQVNAPNLGLGWNPKGSLTKYGGPTLSLSNSANLSGSLKLSKNTTLSGKVNYDFGSSPTYMFGLNIKL